MGYTVRFYIASGLENAEKVKTLSDALESQGWNCTYKWWQHGSVQGQGPKRYHEVASAELNGVRLADVVAVLLPGGRGTHFELGAAVSLGKQTIIFGDPGDFTGTNGDRVCVFHHLARCSAGDPLTVLLRNYHTEDDTEGHTNRTAT